MKHLRILLPLLILALLLSACGSTAREPYDYTYNGKTLKVYPESGTIVDGLNVYRYTAEPSGTSTCYEIVYPNGGRYYWTASKNGGQGGWSDGYNDKLYLSGNILISALEAGRPRDKIGNVGVGLLVMGLGALNFFCPELPFHLRYGWAVQNAEPSESYLLWTKAGGVIAAIAGLAWCIF